jgi:hypothetical protein
VKLAELPALALPSVGQAPLTAQIAAARRPRLITLDRLITLVIAVGFIGVQGAWTVFLGWVALQLLQR